ncbi:Polyketide biosynthesis associated protein [Mycena kentingensis (nom. inval.)]|nr:Polyketide biosynthesis associated protein [Mycena kentingensis (nom. inval.)]
MANNRLVQICVVNDLICPNCAMAQHELFAAIAYCKEELKLPLCFNITFKPFRLIPEATLPSDYEPKVSKAEYFSNIFGADKFGELSASIDKWAVEKGVPISFRGVVSQSTRAHRLSRKAHHIGGMKLQLPFLIAIFRVHLQEGKDIADLDVLSDVAAEVGILSKQDALAFLKSNELEDEVNNMCDRAKLQGVTGVPFIVIDGKWALSGGQCRDVYTQIFKKMAGVPIANGLPASLTSLVPNAPSPGPLPA